MNLKKGKRACNFRRVWNFEKATNITPDLSTSTQILEFHTNIRWYKIPNKTILYFYPIFIWEKYFYIVAFII